MSKMEFERLAKELVMYSLLPVSTRAHGCSSKKYFFTAILFLYSGWIFIRLLMITFAIRKLKRTFS